MPESVAPNIRNRSYTIAAEMEIDTEEAGGVIFSQGSRFGGHALYVKDGKLVYVYNWLGERIQTVVSDETIPTGHVVLSATFEREGDGMPTQGTLTLHIRDQTVGEATIMTQPGKFGLGGGGLIVGRSGAEQVTDDYVGEAPWPFVGGTIKRVMIDVSGESFTDLAARRARRSHGSEPTTNDLGGEHREGARRAVGHPPGGDSGREPPFPATAQRSETATCSRRSIASCMPASIPESMCASRPSLVGCSTRTVRIVRPSTSVSVRVFSAAALGVRDALVHLGRDDPLVRDDLAELAVEADLEPAVRHHHVPPCAAHPQVDLGDRHLAALRVPPAPDQLGRRPRPVDQVLGRVELPRDEDLLVRRERHRRRAATRHRHLLPPSA